MRADFSNTSQLPDYCPINLSAKRDFDIPALGKLTIRLVVINVTDQVYKLRDVARMGVGAPQFGPRRGVYAAFTRDF